MFVDWLEQHQSEGIEACIEFLKAQNDLEDPEVARQRIARQFQNILLVLRGETPWESVIETSAPISEEQSAQLNRQMSDSYNLFKAIQQIMELPEHPERNLWPAQLAESVMVGILTAARIINNQMKQEIAERKEHEAELTRIQTFIAAVDEQNPTGVVVVDAAETIRVLNPAARELLQADKNEVFFRVPLRDYPTPWKLYRYDGHSYASEERPLIRALRGETFRNEWVRIVRADGSERWVSASGNPVYNQEGRIIAGMLVFSNITEARKSEQAMRQLQQRYELVSQATEQILYDYNIPENTITLNGQVESVLGFTGAELSGNTQQWGTLLHPDDLPGITEQLEKARQETQSYDLQYRLRRKDGEYLWVHDRGVYFSDDGGPAGRMLGVIQDITRHRQADEERARLQQEIIEAQQRALKELSVPIIPVMDHILVMPLIGSIDTLRARDITRTLLQGISRYHAQVVILDITGVPLVDSGVAAHLNKTIQAARLKGTRTIVTGISDAVAETIVDLGIDWSNIETLRDLQSGLLVALESLGLQLARKSRRPSQPAAA